MDRYDLLRKAIFEFEEMNGNPELIKMHTEDWWYLQKEFATVESLTQQKMFGIPVEIVYDVPVGEFIIE